MSDLDKKERQQKYFKERIGKIFRLFVSINGYQYNYNGKLLEVWEDKILLDDQKAGEVPIAFEGITVLTVKDVGDNR